MHRPKSVSELKSINFCEMDLNAKIYIKNLGRPVQKINPERSMEQLSNMNRRFPHVYEDNDWICWCDVTDSFYCFPCILYGGAEAWTENGVNDVKNMWGHIQRHKKCIQHLMNIREFENLGKTNTLSDPNSAKEMETNGPFHMNKMKENIQILSNILDWIKHFGGFNLHEHSNSRLKYSADFSNSSFLRGLVELIRDSGLNLKTHSENNSKFNCISEEIAHEILKCVLRISQRHIKEEINQSLFLSIMVSGTSEISQTTKAALILRYVKNSDVVERFWCFLDPASEDPECIAEIILRELEQLMPNCPEKLISQSYDGSLMMSNVYLRIKEVYSNAHYIHSYDHHLYFVLKKVLSQNGKARSFFSNLNRFSSFFKGTPQLREDFNEMIKRRHSNASSNNWDFSVGAIEKLYHHQVILLEFLQKLIDEPSVNRDASHEAFNLKRLLQDKEFKFWLVCFCSFMYHIKALNDEHMLLVDKSMIRKRVAEFLCAVEKLKNFMNKIKNTIQVLQGEIYCMTEVASLNRDTQHVCSVLEKEIKDRFHFTDHFDVASLLLAENFTSYKTKFPQNMIDSVIANFSNFEYDRINLYIELGVLYKNQEFVDISSPQELMLLISESKQETMFSSLVKLIKLVLTLPVVSSTVSTCFSTLRRLQKFLEKTNPPEHLTAITAIHMEKEMIKNIPDFNKKVINLLLSRQSIIFDTIRIKRKKFSKQ